MIEGGHPYRPPRHAMMDTVCTGVHTLPALSVGVAADSSPKGRAKETHGICGCHKKNTRRCGGTLFTKEGKGLEISSPCRVRTPVRTVLNKLFVYFVLFVVANNCQFSIVNCQFPSPTLPPPADHKNSRHSRKISAGIERYILNRADTPVYEYLNELIRHGYENTEKRQHKNA